jgi:hypothetical protein
VQGGDERTAHSPELAFTSATDTLGTAVVLGYVSVMLVQTESLSVNAVASEDVGLELWPRHDAGMVKLLLPHVMLSIGVSSVPML